MFRAFIKDCLEINGKSKAFYSIKKGTIKNDRMTKATSNIEAYEISSNTNIGDILILVNDNGNTMYQGIITSIKDKKIQLSQIQDIYNGTFIYSIVDSLKSSSPSTYLEEEISKVLGNYAGGNLYGCSYVDTLISQKLSPITIQYTGSLTTMLPTDKDDDNNEKYTQKKMVEWIYELYDSYGIVFDFTLPTQQWNNDGIVKIWKPNYSTLKITDGFECISNINPTTETQSVNKLVVYAQDKTYIDTYILTASGIVQHPSSIVGRQNQVNTKIVFSNDTITDIVASELPNVLYNHKIDFSVDLSSKLFTFSDLKLDVPLLVYNEANYYNTIITGKEFSFDENGTISNLKITCGKVRNSLTSKLNLGIAK